MSCASGCANTKTVLEKSQQPIFGVTLQKPERLKPEKKDVVAFRVSSLALKKYSYLICTE